MNDDEYIKEVRTYSSDEVVAGLVSHLVKWKSDDTNTVELADSIERFFGNSWITSKEVHNHLYGLWSSFKAQAISGFAGMTMNERIYWFGLFEIYENASEPGKKAIYTKLWVPT